MNKFIDVRKNENKGFSLIELIVVVAIMAVLVAVLAPSLLAYVERSRAQKDNSAMGEVTNAFKLALADQEIYDEMIATGVNGAAVANAYTDLGNEKGGAFTGSVRGSNITFVSASKTLTIADGVINGDDTLVLSDKCPKTAARIESIVGKTIELTSQTYRNSNYTVFIKMSTLNNATDSAITVHGAWNGTNLSAPTAAGVASAS